eukprot:3694241-Pleurochrysis_carterae.AAC.1
MLYADAFTVQHPLVAVADTTGCNIITVMFYDPPSAFTCLYRCSLHYLCGRLFLRAAGERPARASA